MTTSEIPEPTDAAPADEAETEALAELATPTEPEAARAEDDGADQPEPAADVAEPAAGEEPADVEAPAAESQTAAEPAADAGAGDDVAPAALTPPAEAQPATETATATATNADAEPEPAALTPPAQAQPATEPATATNADADADAEPEPAALTPPAEPAEPPEDTAEESAEESDSAVDDIDPNAGLGLPEAGVVLGPPNLGGFESGEIVTGTVLTVSKREAEIDLGNGKVGVVGDRHWASNDQVDLTTVLTTGDTIEAAVLARADIKKRITLSRLWAQQKRGWEAAERAAKDKSDLQAIVTETVKGGLSLEVNGIRAFMPASLVDVQTVSDLSPYIGQTFEVRVIEADRNKARLIVSRKAAMRASQRQQAKAALGDIKIGQVMTGRVAQITDFGAFVDVEGVRGLVHKSEIGWSRARDPQHELTVGQEVEVQVLKVQPSRNRLGLTMRTENDPLRAVRKGDRYEATVTRLADFGAFVALPSGVEGLVHVSEMAEYRVFAPEEIVIPGEKVWVKVLKVDKKRRTIDLSMAQAVAPDPAAEIAANEAAAAAEAARASEAPSDDDPVDDDHAEDAADDTTRDASEEE